MSLTADERAKFAEWCEQDATTNEGLIEQMKKIPAMEPLIRKKSAEALACRVVAKMLRSIEEF